MELKKVNLKDIKPARYNPRKISKKDFEKLKTNIKEFGFIQFDKSDSIFTPEIILYLIKQGYNLHLLPHGSYLIENKNGRAIETNA